MATYRVQVGEIRDRPYFVLVSARPSLNEIEEFAVVLFYEDPDAEERVEVARIDDAHGYVHLDELYTGERGRSTFDGDVWDAQAYLEANWRRFARLHRENHGSG